MSDRPTASLADDDRARIPFAVIAIFLLITSVGIVATLESRSDPDVDVDPSLAMDRTEVVTQAELRRSTLRAGERAALQPLTRPSDDDLGRAIAGLDAADDVGDADPDETFARYVKLLVYLELSDRIDGTGQAIRQDAEADVELTSPESVSDADDVEEAIDAVTLVVPPEHGAYGDEVDDDLDHRTVRVEVDGIRTTLEEDGRRVGDRTTSVSVAVGTPVFDLHDRVREYERRANMDFDETTDREGLGKQIATRLYPIAWERGYAQTEGEPVSQVVANRHVEVFANEGLYAVQRNVFGDDETHSDEMLSRAYACMLAEDAHGVYRDETGGGDSVHEVVADADDEFCDGSAYAYEDVGADADLSDPPDWTELASQNDYLERDHEADLDEPAESVLGEFENEEAIDRVIDDVYTIDLGLEADVETPHGDGGPDRELIERGVDVHEVETVVDPDDTDAERPLHEVDLTFTAAYEDSGEGVYEEYPITITVVGEHGPRTDVEQRGVIDDYTTGAGGDGSVPVDDNFVEVVYDGRTLEAGLDGVDDADRAAEQLAEHIRSETTTASGDIDGDSVTGPDDVVDIVRPAGDPEVRAEPADRERLRTWLLEDLEDLEAEVSGDSVRFDRYEMLEGDSPFVELREDLDDRLGYSVYEHVGGEYVNAPDKARAEARHDYLARVRDRIEAAVQRHEENRDRLDADLGAYGGGDLETASAFAREQFDRDPIASEYRGDTELLGDVRLAPNAQPSYLTFDRVELESVPAAGEPDDGFVPLAAANNNVYASPYDRSEIELRVVGEVLEAAEAVESAGGSDSDDPPGVRVNFQPPDDELQSGHDWDVSDEFLADTGEPFGERNGETYGWTEPNRDTARPTDAVDRDSVDAVDDRNATLNHFVDDPAEPYDADGHPAWSIELENGEYDVTLVAGDSDHVDQELSFRVEETLFEDDEFDDAADERDTRYARYEGTVEVTDGELAVEPPDGAFNPKINWIEIVPADAAPGSVDGDVDAASLRSELDGYLDDVAEDAGEEAAAAFARSGEISEADFEAAIDAEIEALGPEERRAILLAEGEEGVDRVARNASERIVDDAMSDYLVPGDLGYDYTRAPFERHVEASIRYGLHDAIGDGYVSDPDLVGATRSVGLETRGVLDEADEAAIAERFARARADGDLHNATATPTAEEWLESLPDEDELAPNRNPSGTYLTDRRPWTELTANVWQLHVRGEYARFTVESSTGESYVRDGDPVTLPIDGTERTVGTSEPVAFDSEVSIVVAVPSDGLGVGDRSGEPYECSISYGEVGAIDDDAAFGDCRAP